MYKKKMVKMLALGTSLILGTAILAGCGSGKGKEAGEEQNSKVTLTFLYGISFSRRGCRIWWMLLKRRIRIFMLR